MDILKEIYNSIKLRKFKGSLNLLEFLLYRLYKKYIQPKVNVYYKDIANEPIELPLKSSDTNRIYESKNGILWNPIEKSLAKDWNTKEENEAWEKL